MTVSDTHNAPEFKHADDMDWEMGRFGNVTKFLFHPRPERPTEPNAGFLKYAPGASHSMSMVCLNSGALCVSLTVMSRSPVSFLKQIGLDESVG